MAISKTARGRARKVMARRWDGDRSTRVSEPLVVEEPLEIHVDGTLAASTMRTPGHDFELAVGFCAGEGWIGAGGVETVRYCGTGSAIETEFNVVSVDRREPRPEISPRIGPTTSSCGWCGTAGVEQLLERFEPMPAAAVAAGVVAAVGERVRVRQDLFALTGGSHAAASFSSDGTIRHVREDIGRHNAVDKLLGRDVLDATAPRPGDGSGLFVSGRASFELVQKAWAGGFSMMVAVSAPSALAVSTAETAGLTLVAFARDERLTVYAGALSPQG
ncbi:MAG: formate dehydrogenase accessory sulfurtransferase FdhD [Acidimicrobiales bacterium]